MVQGLHGGEGEQGLGEVHQEYGGKVHFEGVFTLLQITNCY